MKANSTICIATKMSIKRSLSSYKEIGIGKLATVAVKHVYCGNFERLGLCRFSSAWIVNPLIANMQVANSTNTAFPNLY
jgi:hypothetical protein